MAKYDTEQHPLVYAGPSEIHGTGLFARKAIRKGRHIGTYEGPSTRKDGMHVLWVYDENDQNPVGRNGKNILRYCNHSSRPNAEFDGFELYAVRGIKKDEEITFHYGDDWDDEE
ncbi:SET domain-containing protein [Natronospira proteinivora]|uniref:SET domain-containing protein n=1 Tax=Natronospira proteinivora TaxID=1807133 RepID=A0ABT1GEC3_9GAMM|nr:SET domain-containing protein [Natronospira proteinivora]MCP1728302.1 SET domain-containing protein [Natronospira proteinivora]